MDDLNARLIGCFSIVFPDLPDGEIPKASTENTATWDSVAAITLMNVIEDEFQVRLDLEEIAELNSFDKVRTYVQQQVQ